MTNDNRQKRIESELKAHFDLYRDEMICFEDNFKSNPADALRRSSQAFQAAAFIEVYWAVLNMVEAEDSFDTVLGYLKKEVLYSGQNPQFYTSPTVELFHQYRTKAVAQIFWLLNDKSYNF